MKLQSQSVSRGVTAAEKLSWPRFGSQHRDACAPLSAKDRAKCWVRDRGRPLPLWGSGVSPPFGNITPGKFLKTQMLNPALWWLLDVKFLAFRTAKKLGDQYIVGPPQPKSWGPVSPGPYDCCAYECNLLILTYKPRACGNGNTRWHHKRWSVFLFILRCIWSTSRL